MPCNRSHRALSLRIFRSALMVLAMIVAAGAAEAPCADCASERTLPSADVVPDVPASAPPNDPAVQAHLPGQVNRRLQAVRCGTRSHRAALPSCLPHLES